MLRRAHRLAGMAALVLALVVLAASAAAPASAAAYAPCIRHILDMADMISSGIIQQFPEQVPLSR